MFHKICIIGIGLIGGSIAKAARKQKLAKGIVAYGRHEDIHNLRLAKQLDVIDEFYLSIADAVKDADCVIIATPVGAIQAIFTILQPVWNADTVYSDVGSTKCSVLEAAVRVFGEVPANFIAAHPIAGTEKSGVSAAQYNLFNDRHVLLTSLTSSAPKALQKITEFWHKMGGKVSTINATHHDTVLAATSHLPHIIAFVFLDLLGEQEEQLQVFTSAHTIETFKYYSRITASNPQMWLDICVANQKEILPLIQKLQDKLKAIQQMLGDNNIGELSKLSAEIQHHLSKNTDDSRAFFKYTDSGGIASFIHSATVATATDPKIWLKNICQDINLKTELMDLLTQVHHKLTQVTHALLTHNSQQIIKIFTHAGQVRQHILEHSQQKDN